MSKIRLSIEDLTVESFATCAAEGGHGTVFGNAKTIDICESAQQTECAPECETWYGVGVCSANDGCASSPHAYTDPCNGCVETDHFCVIDGGELG
jgi:hypothetical protein